MWYPYFKAKGKSEIAETINYGIGYFISHKKLCGGPAYLNMKYYSENAVLSRNPTTHKKNMISFELFNYLLGIEILEISDGKWTAVSSGTYPGMPKSQLYDGYVSTVYHSNHGWALFQWIQVNFGREIKVCFMIIVIYILDDIERFF